MLTHAGTNYSEDLFPLCGNDDSRTISTARGSRLSHATKNARTILESVSPRLTDSTRRDCANFGSSSTRKEYFSIREILTLYHPRVKWFWNEFLKLVADGPPRAARPAPTPSADRLPTIHYPLSTIRDQLNPPRAAAVILALTVIQVAIVAALFILN